MTPAYLLRRLLMVLPALFGITIVTFCLINLVPGGALERKLHVHEAGRPGMQQGGRTAQGLSPAVIAAIRRQYGLDRPLLTRYFAWLGDLARLDFGVSFDYDRPVLDVISERLPVSLQFGVASFVLIYAVSVPLGVLMSYRAGTWVDRSSRALLLLATALPSFAFAVLLLVFFAGGSFLNWFPLGFLQSESYASLSWPAKVGDRVHHFVLPLLAYVIGSFAPLAFLTRNSLLKQIGADYVRTAKAFGASRPQVFFRHAFRNALLPIVTGLGGYLAVFLSGSLLIETIFQLNGIGRLSYQCLLSRDYNMIMALTVLQGAAVLLGNVLSDLIYACVDPRIAFE